MARQIVCLLFKKTGAAAYLKIFGENKVHKERSNLMISFKTNFEQTTRQELRLSPHLVLSVEILQLDSVELADYLNKLSEENPMLELGLSASSSEDLNSVRYRERWLAPSGFHTGTISTDMLEISKIGVSNSLEESLSFFVSDQLERASLPKPLLTVCQYLVSLLDDNGYLQNEDLELLRSREIPPDLLDRGIQTIQSMEPAGIGARSLSECLMLQCQRFQNSPPYAQEIISRFLPEISRGHYGPICHALQINNKDVQQVVEYISKLNPRPGAEFQADYQPQYVIPDIYIIEQEGNLQTVINDVALPRLSINNYYRQLLNGPLDNETREYLQKKLQQINWVRESILHRNTTIQKCAERIMDVQQEFFRGNTTKLAPMSFSEMAEYLDLHPSTISRAIKNKYLQCNQGTFPLRYFFNRAVGSQGVSRQSVKQLLLHLIREENHDTPYSDQELYEILVEQKIDISRRTIAKYRLESGIPSSTMRRKKYRNSIRP